MKKTHDQLDHKDPHHKDILEHGFEYHCALITHQ